MANFFHARDVDETEQDVAAGRVVLVELVVSNPGNATAYVKLWDDVMANVDPATDAATRTFGVPAGQTIPIPLHGVQFVAMNHRRWLSVFAVGVGLGVVGIAFFMIFWNMGHSTDAADLGARVALTLSATVVLGLTLKAADMLTLPFEDRVRLEMAKAHRRDIAGPRATRAIQQSVDTAVREAQTRARVLGEGLDTTEH